MKLLTVSFFMISSLVPITVGSVEVISKKYLVKITKNQSSTSQHFDLNGDGLVDRIETHRQKSLQVLEEDLSLKGQLNSKTEFFEFKNETTPVEINSIDSNYDGRVDRIVKVYRHEKLKKLISSHEVDTTFSGRFDKTFTTFTDLVQKNTQVQCSVGMLFDDAKILKLEADVNNIQSQLSNGYYVSDFGYKIHQSCLKNWGSENFVNTLKKSMSKGIACLKELTGQSKDSPHKQNGAALNLKKLDLLLDQSKVTIACHQTQYDWQGTVAHASVSPSDKVASPALAHPYISLNPTYPKNKTRPGEEENADLEKTLFHEQLHNLGIRHSENLEYPYTCETCCMTKKDEANQKLIESACKVCRGDYKDTKDMQYLKDLNEWGKLDFQQGRAASAVTKFLKENPADRQALQLLADANTSIFNPVGVQMATKLKAELSPLSDEEKNKIEEILKNKDNNRFSDPQVERFASIASEALLNRHKDNDPQKMMQHLEQNKQSIKILLIKQSKATDNDQYILGHIKDSIKNSLMDTWLEGYPNTNRPVNNRAYKLLNELKML